MWCTVLPGALKEELQQFLHSLWSVSVEEIRKRKKEYDVMYFPSITNCIKRFTRFDHEQNTIEYLQHVECQLVGWWVGTL